MVKINLLDAKHKEVLDRQAKLERWLKWGVVALVVGVVLVSGSGGVWWWRKSVLSDKVELLSQKEDQLKDFAQLSVASQGLVERLGGVAEILPKRRQLEQKLALFFNVYTQDLEVDTVDFRGDGDVDSIGVSGSVSSVSSYLSINEEVLNIAETEQLKRVLLENISRSEVGEYRVAYTLTLDPDKDILEVVGE